MCDLQAGDVVECIDDTPIRERSREMPQLGIEYRIQSIRRVGDGFSVRLVELIPECYLGGPCQCGECGWDARRFYRFRRRDRLAVFRKLLEVPGVLEDA